MKTVFAISILMLSLSELAQSDNTTPVNNTKQTTVNGNPSWEEVYEEFRKKWMEWKEAQQ